MSLNKGDMVIIRSKDSGVHYGIFSSRIGRVVELVNSRRIWTWDGAFTLSELAVHGTARPNNCEFSIEVPEIEVLDTCEIIKMTPTAIDSLNNVPSKVYSGS